MVADHDGYRLIVRRDSERVRLYTPAVPDVGSSPP